MQSLNFADYFVRHESQIKSKKEMQILLSSKEKQKSCNSRQGLYQTYLLHLLQGEPKT